MLDQQSLISGLAILMSFFVGYKYGLKIQKGKDDEWEDEEPQQSTSKVKVTSMTLLDSVSAKYNFDHDLTALRFFLMLEVISKCFWW